jgi:hypothetical protein
MAQDELDAVKIAVGALLKSNPAAHATLCMELLKSRDAALLTGRPGLAAELTRWIDLLGCK